VKDKKGTMYLLTKKFIEENMGVKFEMRSPLYCTTDKICSKCAGELYYSLGFRNIGGLLSRMTSNLLAASLKLRHDMSIKTKEIDFISALKKV